VKARTTASVVGVVLVLVVALLGWQVATGGGDEVRSSIVGRAAPAVQGTAIDGRTVDIDRWRGSWVVVNFFATWCVPCVREHPELVDFAERHVDDDVEMVSIAFDDTPQAIERFFAERGGDWPVLASDTGGMALDYGVRGVPESFLIAPDGRVVGLFYGVTADGLDGAINAYAGSGQATEPTAGQPGSTRPPGAP
jgi:cytochrome c biogenesis protein CcmG, thiol:disulfide interchange protein DsbE